VFKSSQRLKDHLKVHKERQADMDSRPMDSFDKPEGGTTSSSANLKKRRQNEVDGGGRSPKLAKLIDGEAGKEHACEEEGCEKRFKTVRCRSELSPDMVGIAFRSQNTPSDLSSWHTQARLPH